MIFICYISISSKSITFKNYFCTYLNTDFQRELHTAKYLDELPNAQPTLDEITNKVFEELLVGKSRNKYQYSEGSCKVNKIMFKI